MSEFNKPSSERSDEAKAALATVAAAIDDAMDSAFRKIERSAGTAPDLLAEAIAHYAGFRMARRWRTWSSSCTAPDVDERSLAAAEALEAAADECWHGQGDFVGQWLRTRAEALRGATP